MPMFYGGGYGLGWLGALFAMIIPLALLGLVVYWAVNAGVRNALKKIEPVGALDVKYRKAGKEAENDITKE